MDSVNRITASEFASQIEGKETMVIDVCKNSDYAEEHVKDAYSKPLAFINDWVNYIDPETSVLFTLRRRL